MGPLFKYTGGKYGEYGNICNLLPSSINNYYEPFVGGGGILFKLNENQKISGKNYINDYSKSLIEFYRCVGKDEFKTELNKLNDSWDKIRDFSKKIAEKFGDRYFDIIQGRLDEDFVNKQMKQSITRFVNNFSYNIHNFSLRDEIIEQLEDKTKRFKRKKIDDSKTDVPFKSITTAICQAFYFVIRNMYNDWNVCGNWDKYTINERSAHWTFIREFCFGSMFRFGKDGKFNIPYGGFSYNDKCFKCKIDKIFSDDARFISENTESTCLDFEEAIKSYNFADDDFIFLDPPYDSTFSEYDGNEFSKADHKRLAGILKHIKCKWMMIIGKTDFIYNLYKDFNILEYDKTYMYQARCKYNNKKTKHIIITNYK